METADVECLRLAARQRGVVTRAQARQRGLSNRAISRRIESGLWEPLYPSVYRVEGSPRTWQQRLAAALLWAGRGAAVSHRAAGALHGFARFRAGPIELSVCRNLRMPAPAVVHRLGILPWRELVWLEGLTVTSATRTLVDLSATEDAPTLRATVDEALRRRWTTLDRLQVALSRAAHRPGVAALRAIVTQLVGGDAPAESELEARVAELLETAGFPRPVKQQVVRVGGVVRRMDFRLPGTPVVIEADGYAYHSGFDTFERQRDRHRALASRGFLVVPWTWASVRDQPEHLIRQLHATLAQTRRAHPTAEAALESRPSRAR